MNPEVKDLVLRVHTRIDGANPFPLEQNRFELPSPKWPKYALLIDGETTTEELGQKLNFAFFQGCESIHEEYTTIVEGIIIADDLAERLGQKAVAFLNTFAKRRADTVCGRFATIRVYTRSEFITKVFFPWVVLKNAMVVGANLAFDLSVLSVAYHEHKTENGFSSELAPRYKGRENKRYPRLRTVPKNSRTAFFELSGGTGPYKCGKRKRGWGFDKHRKQSLVLQNSYMDHRARPSECGLAKPSHKGSHRDTPCSDWYSKGTPNGEDWRSRNRSATRQSVHSLG